MRDLPRLLLCSFELIPGPSGSSRRVTEYLRALDGHFSVVVLCTKTPDHSHIEKYQGARLLRVPVGSGDLGSRLQAYERAVRRQLESEEYAIAHFLDPHAGQVLCELKGDHGYRLVYEAQTFPSQVLPALHPGVELDARLLARLRRQELYCLMNADRVLTGSELTRSYLQGLGASAELVRVLRAPVPVPSAPPPTREAAPDAPLELVYVGSQLSWQGLACLLNAVALAAAQLPVQLRLVGPRHPAYAPPLEALVEELRLTERVQWLPPVAHDALPALLASADVAVLPLEDVEHNRIQGAPLAKLSDYLAAGLPVVAADLPLTRELLPSSAALFHPAGDAHALAAQLVTLGRSPALRQQLGAAGHASAARTVASPKVGAELIALYGTLLTRSASTAPPALSSSPLRAETQRLPPIRGGEAVAEPTPSSAAPVSAPPSPAPEPALASAAPEPFTDPARPLAGISAPRAAPPPLPPRTLSRVGLAALPPPEPPRPAPAPPQPLVAEEAEEILEVDESLVEPAELEPAASALAPWLAQLAHGYCPPEGTRFTRHTPPTNFPGREDEPTPTRAPLVRGK